MRPTRRWLRIVVGTVVAVVGIAACRAAVSLFTVCGQTNEDVARLDLRAIGNAIDMYDLKHERLPSSLDDLVPQEMKELRHDPWGHSWVFMHSEESNLFEVASAGVDGEFGTPDDIVSWGRREAASNAAPVDPGKPPLQESRDAQVLMPLPIAKCDGNVDELKGRAAEVIKRLRREGQSPCISTGCEPECSPGTVCMDPTPTSPWGPSCATPCATDADCEKGAVCTCDVDDFPCWACWKEPTPPTTPGFSPEFYEPGDSAPVPGLDAIRIHGRSVTIRVTLKDTGGGVDMKSVNFSVNNGARVAPTTISHRVATLADVPLDRHQNGLTIRASNNAGEESALMMGFISCAFPPECEGETFTSHPRR